MNVPILIPAFHPCRELPALAADLAAGDSAGIVIVDDGSGPNYEPVFAAAAAVVGVRVLRHETNHGKGAALKTALRAARELHPDATGFVTADADGQHHPEDTLRVARRLAENPECLVLGSRRFGAGTPWRSRTGNLITRSIVSGLLGQKLADTQTGLRGIPESLLPHLLTLGSDGYEFELEMILLARRTGLAIIEEPIRTIYKEGNRGSHFHPLLDSARIYTSLLRNAAPLVSACVRNRTAQRSLSSSFIK